MEEASYLFLFWASLSASRCGQPYPPCRPGSPPAVSGMAVGSCDLRWASDQLGLGSVATSNKNLQKTNKQNVPGLE